MLDALDPVWERIQIEAKAAVEKEPLLGGSLHSCILHHSSIEQALAYRIAAKLASQEMSEQILRELCDDAYKSEGELSMAGRADIVAVYQRILLAILISNLFLFFKGSKPCKRTELRIGFGGRGRKDMAYFLQMRCSEVFGIDIHPGARIGKGIMIDHAHSIVIGETAVVGDNVSMLHSVTLGGTGKDDEIRHPNIGDGVLLGAGAKVLGNISVGSCSRVAAGSVVLQNVPEKQLSQVFPPRLLAQLDALTHRSVWIK